MTAKSHWEPASFRDPAGRVFYRAGDPYRAIFQPYIDVFRRLQDSGLYDQLVAKNWLIPHQVCDLADFQEIAAAAVIKPAKVPFVSYPYEWCFSQLRDAAILTLDIQACALDKGLSLKDASAFNIQFVGGQPRFIDTLSFEPLAAGQPWVAYRSFCQHFLAPLALMAYSDVRLNRLSAVHIDGVPLDLATKLLPKRSWLKLSLLMHLHAHARFQSRYQDRPEKAQRQKKPYTVKEFRELIQHLRDTVEGLRWRLPHTEWGDYYDDIHYTDQSLTHKKKVVGEFLDRLDVEVVWDLGANRGDFSQLAAQRGMRVIAFDVDPVAVERNYQRCVEEGESRILPLITDLTNPSPALGWDHSERKSLAQRGPADVVMALALVHHLVIGNNVPFTRLAAYFASQARYLIIEFVPIEDPMAKGLMAARRDSLAHYSEASFREAFAVAFDLIDEVALESSPRRMFLFKRKG